MPNSMQHCNGHQICAMDLETTGLDAHFNEILQIAIVPLDANIEPRKDVLPFYIEMKPEHPERIDRKAIQVNRMDIAKIAVRGFDQEKAKDLLHDWTQKLGLPCTRNGIPKRIIPLGHNFAFDRDFLLRWLGVSMYSDYFDARFRDTCVAAQYLNDRAAMHSEKVLFPKTTLTYMCSTLKIENERAHDALQDCLATARVYKRLLMSGLL